MTVHDYLIGLWDAICAEFSDETDNQRQMRMSDLGRLSKVIAKYVYEKVF